MNCTAYWNEQPLLPGQTTHKHSGLYLKEAQEIMKGRKGYILEWLSDGSKAYLMGGFFGGFIPDRVEEAKLNERLG